MNAIHKSKGGDEFVQEKGGLHFGVQKVKNSRSKYATPNISEHIITETQKISLGMLLSRVCLDNTLIS